MAMNFPVLQALNSLSQSVRGGFDNVNRARLGAANYQLESAKQDFEQEKFTQFEQPKRQREVDEIEAGNEPISAFSLMGGTPGGSAMLAGNQQLQDDLARAVHPDATMDAHGNFNLPDGSKLPKYRKKEFMGKWATAMLPYLDPAETEREILDAREDNAMVAGDDDALAKIAAARKRLDDPAYKVKIRERHLADLEKIQARLISEGATATDVAGYTTQIKRHERKITEEKANAAVKSKRAFELKKIKEQAKLKDARSTMQKDSEYLAKIKNISESEAVDMLRSDKKLSAKFTVYNTEIRRLVEEGMYGDEFEKARKAIAVRLEIEKADTPAPGAAKNDWRNYYNQTGNPEAKLQQAH